MKKPMNGLMFARTIKNYGTLLCCVIQPHPEIKGEAQHEFTGYVNKKGIFSLQSTGKVIDIQEHSIGNTPDGLLTMPIWRT